MSHLIKLSLSEINSLKNGTKLFINPTSVAMKKAIEPMNFTLVRKDGNVYTLMNTDFYDFMDTGKIPENRHNLKNIVHELKYIVGGYNGFELLLETKNDESLKENIDIESLKKELHTFVREYTKNTTQFLIQMYSIENICSKVERDIKHAIEYNLSKKIIFKLSSKAIGNFTIKYDVELNKFDIIKENDKTNVCNDTKEKIVHSDLIIKHLYDTDMTFKIVSEEYTNLIDKAIQIEDDLIECDGYCDSLNDFLEGYLLEDYHTSKDTMKFLIHYASESELKDIMEKSLIYAI